MGMVALMLARGRALLTSFAKRCVIYRDDIHINQRLCGVRKGPVVACGLRGRLINESNLGGSIVMLGLTAPDKRLTTKIKFIN